MLSSCGEEAQQSDPAADEALMTEYSENLTITQSENGRRSYRFSTPLVEGYSQAREPYREFRKGIRMVTYQDDSLSSVDVILTANYAIYYENRKLWEAKGNVVVEKFDGKKLYTQQLFWNATTKKVYSNVDTRVVQEGRSDIIGAGFESDEEFKDWRFRYMKGRTEVDMTPREPTDSLDRGAQADSLHGAEKPAASTPASTAEKAPAAKADSKAQPPQPETPAARPTPTPAPASAPKPTPKPATAPAAAPSRRHDPQVSATPVAAQPILDPRPRKEEGAARSGGADGK